MTMPVEDPWGVTPDATGHAVRRRPPGRLPDGVGRQSLALLGWALLACLVTMVPVPLFGWLGELGARDDPGDWVELGGWLHGSVVGLFVMAVGWIALAALAFRTHGLLPVWPLLGIASGAVGLFAFSRAPSACAAVVGHLVAAAGLLVSTALCAPAWTRPPARWLLVCLAAVLLLAAVVLS